MKRFPHTLRRDGLSSSSWTLKGPVIIGKFTPPGRGRPGQYHSALLRIRYESLHERKIVLRFQTPRLARGGHRLMGEARLTGTDRGVEVRSTVAEDPPLWLGVKKGGFLNRQMHLVRSDGVIVATLRSENERFDVDLNADACRWFAPPGDVEAERTRRVVESGVVMFLAALVEDVRRGGVPEPEEPRERREMSEVVTRLLRRRTPEGGPATGQEAPGGPAP